MTALLTAAIIALAALILLRLDQRRPTPAPVEKPTPDAEHEDDWFEELGEEDIPTEHTSPVDYGDTTPVEAPADMDDDVAEQYVEFIDEPTPTLADIDTEVEQSLQQVPTVRTPIYRTLAEENPAPVEEEPVEPEALQEPVEHEAPVEEESTPTETQVEEDAAAHSTIHPLLKAVPIIARRERKTWAEANGFEYIKEDDYLGDEWSRGPAATPGTARDIVRGVVCGYDMHLLDLGGASLLALRRADISDIVIEAHSNPEEADSTFVPGPTIGRYTLSANEEGVLDRLVDSRLTTAVANLPEDVDMFWAESDWVVARLPKKAAPQTWDDTCAPLAMIADVMHALPASGLLGAWPTDGLDVDPTRPLPHPTEWEPEEEPTPAVARPEEPVDLPTRAVGSSYGHVPMTDVGGDELDAIADKLVSPNPHGAPRLVRNQPLDSAIFHDADSGRHHHSDEAEDGES